MKGVATLETVRAGRLLQFINVLIGLVLIVVAAGVYWLGWRPLPESGAVQAPVSTSVTVERDELGMPRIQASSAEDLFFAQGFVTAQDRFWQMETFRRRTAGELSEIVGPVALPSDREFRELRASRIAERQAKTLTPDDRLVLAAYVRGVNYYLETHRDRLPMEFALLGYKPRPWRIEDTLLVGLMMYHSLSNTHKHDLARTAMLEKGDPEKVKRLWPARTGMEEQPGSNAWAASGTWTGTSKPILANDMHLQWSFPGAWYMVGLRGAGYHVAGVSIPGVPGVVVGRNENIAWGITNLGFDAQDLYFESINTVTGSYMSGGVMKQAVQEQEQIAVKGQPPTVIRNWITERGPVIAGPGGKPVSLRWTAAEDRPFRLTLPQLNRARNWNEFRDAMRTFPVASSNVAYADATGNVGLQVMGLLPIRKGCDGQLVVPAGSCEWEGFIPFEELPSFYNPPSGLLTTGNQNPFPKDYPYTVSGNFAPHYRAMQMRSRLTSKKGWTAEEMVGVQTDVYSVFSHWFAKELVAAWDRRPGTSKLAAGAVDQLRTWDGQMREDQAAPLIVSYATNYLRVAVAAKASGMQNAEWEPYIYFAVMENLVRERPAGWFPNWDDELRKCLEDAAGDASRQQGNDPLKWTYGAWNRIALINPVTARIPGIGGYLGVGPVGISGSATTVKQTNLRLGPSMRLVADFGRPDGGLLNIVAGQSGHPMSRNYKDQFDAYIAGRSFPLHFSGGWNVRSTLVLQPAGK